MGTFETGNEIETKIWIVGILFIILIGVIIYMISKLDKVEKEKASKEYWIERLKNEKQEVTNALNHYMELAKELMEQLKEKDMDSQNCEAYQDEHKKESNLNEQVSRYVEKLRKQNEELKKKNSYLAEKNRCNETALDVRRGMPERIIVLEAKIEELQEHLKREQRGDEKIKEQLLKAMEANDELQEQLAEITSEKNMLLNKVKRIADEDKRIQHALEQFKSNVTAIPYMAGVIADCLTYDIENLAKQLNWGDSIERKKKVTSIREIRKEAKKKIEEAKNAEYQLAYLMELYPELEDILETDFSEIPQMNLTEISEERDRTRDYLSKEEWDSLSTVEKNQLALNRYVEGRKKSKWQIGRDYELYVGFRYEREGYNVDYCGSYLKMEDMGRDLIAKKGNNILIIQCKYWSQKKVIREKHIAQLFGTTVSYCIENHLELENVRGIFVTNIQLSAEAKKFAEYLKIGVQENLELSEFPRIKCNIGKDSGGRKVKIYHLPFDQQYDNTKIDSPGEFFAMTVQEAEDAGFRRALKWFGNNN